MENACHYLQKPRSHLHMGLIHHYVCVACYISVCLFIFKFMKKEKKRKEKLMNKT